MKYLLSFILGAVLILNLFALILSIFELQSTKRNDERFRNQIEILESQKLPLTRDLREESNSAVCFDSNMVIISDVTRCRVIRLTHQTK